jgi:hypothetical protein
MSRWPGWFRGTSVVKLVCSPAGPTRPAANSQNSTGTDARLSGDPPLRYDREPADADDRISLLRRAELAPIAPSSNRTDLPVSLSGPVRRL